MAKLLERKELPDVTRRLKFDRGLEGTGWSQSRKILYYAERWSNIRVWSWLVSCSCCNVSVALVSSWHEESIYASQVWMLRPSDEMLVAATRHGPLSASRRLIFLKLLLFLCMPTFLLHVCSWIPQVLIVHLRPRLTHAIYPSHGHLLIVTGIGNSSVSTSFCGFRFRFRTGHRK